MHLWHISGLEPRCSYMQAIGMHTVVHTWAELSSGCQQRDILGFPEVPGLPLSLQYLSGPPQLTLFPNRGTTKDCFSLIFPRLKWKAGYGEGGRITVVQIYCRVNYKMSEIEIETHKAQIIICLMHSDVTERPVKLAGHFVTVVDCAIW